MRVKPQVITVKEANPDKMRVKPQVITVKEANPDQRDKLYDLEQLGGDDDSRSHWGWARQQFKELVDNVSISGVRYVISDEEPMARRVLWCVLILSGMFFMAFQIADRVQYLLEYPTETSVREVLPSSAAFPAVTICSENIFRLSAAKALGAEQALAPLIPSLFQGGQSAPVQTNLTSSDWGATWAQLGFQKQDLLKQCFFAGRPCSAADFTSRPADFNLCHTFNFNGSRTTHLAGCPGGLFVLLNAHEKEGFTSLGGQNGFRVAVHDPEERPTVFETGVMVGTGVTTKISIRRREVKLLPPPYGQCSVYSKLINGQKFTNNNCLKLCEMEVYLERCGCVGFQFADMGLPVCDVATTASCVMPTMYDLIVSNNCTCDPGCHETVYDLTVFSSGFLDSHINNTIAQYPKDFPTPVDFHKNFVALGVAFVRLSYTEVVQQRAYDTLSLFCDMGGALGLLLGSTFFTLYEFFDFCFWTFPRMLSK